MLRAGRSGNQIPEEERFSAPVQTGSTAHSASYTMGTGVFSGGKEAGTSRLPPTPSSAKVKERVEVNLYSPYGSSWHVLRWNLLLPLHLKAAVNISKKYWTHIMPKNTATPDDSEHITLLPPAEATSHANDNL
jgi:hypothetical protein